MNIPNNKPLTQLLNGLSSLGSQSIPMPYRTETQPLDYERVLRLFDDTLRLTDWPQNDWKECTSNFALGSVSARPGLQTALSLLPSQLPRPAAAHERRHAKTNGSKRPFPPVPEEVLEPYIDASQSTNQRRRVNCTMGPPTLPTSGTSAISATRTRSGKRTAKKRSGSRQGTQSSSRQEEMREKRVSGGHASWSIPVTRIGIHTFAMY